MQLGNVEFSLDLFNYLKDLFSLVIELSTG